MVNIQKIKCQKTNPMKTVRISVINGESISKIETKFTCTVISRLTSDPANEFFG